jgi:hypothetical protein
MIDTKSGYQRRKERGKVPELPKNYEEKRRRHRQIKLDPPASPPKPGDYLTEGLE